MYECDTCDRRFGSQRACDQHMDALGHHDTRYECDECPRRFDTWSACKKHMTKNGHWIWEYECETCSSRFCDEWDLEDHMDEEDHWSYPYDCETCTPAFRNEDARDEHQDEEGHYAHLHCQDCDRYFQSANNLQQHLNSRLHRGADVNCPFCKAGFVTASGVAHHLESAACPKARNLDRTATHRALRQRDPGGLITERLLEWSTEADRDARWDPASAWNGRGYECYVCHRVFGGAQSLRQHVFSPIHQAPLYHCPNKRGSCGGKKFPTLAALFNHLESQTCDYVRFETVQKGVNGFFSAGSQKAIKFA